MSSDAAARSLLHPALPAPHARAAVARLASLAACAAATSFCLCAPASFMRAPSAPTPGSTSSRSAPPSATPRQGTAPPFAPPPPPAAPRTRADRFASPAAAPPAVVAQRRPQRLPDPLLLQR